MPPSPKMTRSFNSRFFLLDRWLDTGRILYRGMGEIEPQVTAQMRDSFRGMDGILSSIRQAMIQDTTAFYEKVAD